MSIQRKQQTTSALFSLFGLFLITYAFPLFAEEPDPTAPGIGLNDDYSPKYKIGKTQFWVIQKGDSYEVFKREINAPSGAEWSSSSMNELKETARKASFDPELAFSFDYRFLSDQTKGKLREFDPDRDPYIEVYDKNWHTVSRYPIAGFDKNRDTFRILMPRTAYYGETGGDRRYYMEGAQAELDPAKDPFIEMNIAKLTRHQERMLTRFAEKIDGVEDAKRFFYVGDNAFKSHQQGQKRRFFSHQGKSYALDEQTGEVFQLGSQAPLPLKYERVTQNNGEVRYRAALKDEDWKKQAELPQNFLFRKKEDGTWPADSKTGFYNAESEHFFARYGNDIDALDENTTTALNDGFILFRNPNTPHKQFDGSIYAIRKGGGKIYRKSGNKWEPLKDANGQELLYNAADKDGDRRGYNEDFAFEGNGDRLEMKGVEGELFRLFADTAEREQAKTESEPGKDSISAIQGSAGNNNESDTLPATESRVRSGQAGGAMLPPECLTDEPADADPEICPTCGATKEGALARSGKDRGTPTYWDAIRELEELEDPLLRAVALDAAWEELPHTEAERREVILDRMKERRKEGQKRLAERKRISDALDRAPALPTEKKKESSLKKVTPQADPKAEKGESILDRMERRKKEVLEKRKKISDAPDKAPALPTEKKKESPKKKVTPQADPETDKVSRAAHNTHQHSDEEIRRDLPRGGQSQAIVPKMEVPVFKQKGSSKKIEIEF